MEKFRYLKKEAVNKLPKTSGVYCFKDNKEILYIGKATNIRERVKQHRGLLSLAKQLGCLKTDSEIEALILEANLIKKYQPKYNIVWRDDKNYFYVAVTKEDFPKVSIIHQPQINGGSISIIGPFVEGTSLKKTLTYLRKVFPYYTTKKHPKKSCLWCQLKLCPGPNPNKKEYQKNIRNLTQVLKGKSNSVLKNLKREMEKFSLCQNYEKAAGIRDQTNALIKIISHARITEEPTVPQTSPWHYKRIEAYDISNIQGKEATGSMVVFTDGQSDKSQYRRFKIKIEGKPNDVAMIKEILKRRLKHYEWPYPNLILIDGGKPQLNVAVNSKSQIPNSKRIKVMAIAKKKNELYVEGKSRPILLKSLPREIFNLILQLRDEAHRFAIAYHHKLRVKALLKR